MPAPSPTHSRRPPLPRQAAAALILVLSLVACGGEEDEPRAASTTLSSSPTTSMAPSVTAPAIGTQSGRLDALPDPVAVAPVALRIPSLGVDAPVRAVGVDAIGEMEVPAATDVGWYRFGPAPGDDGSAVLAAHVDYDGRRGVFFALRQLQPGSRVDVTLADGSVQGYEVERVAQIAKGDLAASGVFDRTGPPRLALITCGGTFDAAARSYRDNIVAYAAPVPVPAAGSGVVWAVGGGLGNARSAVGAT
jgi:LPXTG-site transpeptidase (sortase) family protein